MRAGHDTRYAADRGLTLTELLITIAIMGIVVTVLASATTTFLRNQHSATERVDQNRGLQQLVNYLPHDVASAQTVSLSAPDLCGVGGTPVLHMTWEERFGSNEISVQVTYRETLGAENTLTRASCQNGGPAQQVVLARGYDWLEVNSATFSNGRVLVTIQYPDARRTIVGQSRNLREETP